MGQRKKSLSEHKNLIQVPFPGSVNNEERKAMKTPDPHIRTQVAVQWRQDMQKFAF